MLEPGSMVALLEDVEERFVARGALLLEARSLQLDLDHVSLCSRR
jgi:hypothetical protein